MKKGKIFNCIVCNQEFYREPRAVKKGNCFYCSNSCKAVYLNKTTKKKIKICNYPNCNNERNRDNVYCLEHNPTKILLSKTIKEIQLKRGSNKNTRIRDNGRIIAKENNLLNKCALCNFTRIIECCHIIGISKWPEETLLSIVNHPNNLIGLCPNHHWCFDHKQLTEEELKAINTIIKNKITSST